MRYRGKYVSGLLPLAMLCAVTAILLSQTATAQQPSGNMEVVTLMCEPHGKQMVVTSVSPSQRGVDIDADGASQRADCADTLSELLSSGMQLSSATGAGQLGTVYTLVSPILDLDELGLTYRLDARGCNCDDALPITGFTCKSCSITEVGCFCLFKKTVP